MSAPHYNSPLLDEIHHMFPALLYTPEQFQSVPSVLQYIQRQVSQRYDLFTRGREAYLRQQHAHHHRHHIHAPVETSSNPIRGIVRSETELAQSLINEILTPHINLSPQSIIGLLFPSAANAATAAAAQVPSQQEIHQATLMVNAEEEGVCSICQESYEVGTAIKKIRHCQHSFHPTCINTWFARDVRCPMCRHDIRTPTTSRA